MTCPKNHSSYTSWASDGWGEKGGGSGPSHGWESYSHPYNHGWDEEEEDKGLTDEEIMKSKRKEVNKTS